MFESRSSLEKSITLERSCKLEHQRSNTGLYGAGIYLTESAAKSDQYMEPYFLKKDRKGKIIDIGENIYALPLVRTSLGRIMGSFETPVTVPWPSWWADKTMAPGVSKAKALRWAARNTVKRAGVISTERKSWITPDIENEFKMYYDGADLRSATTLVGVDTMQGRNDGYEFLVYNGAACYIQYVLFYKRNLASKDEPTAPLTSADLTRAMHPFLLKSDKALYGDWSFPKQIPRSISYRYEVNALMNIQGPVRMFVHESYAWPLESATDNGDEHTPRFLYVVSISHIYYHENITSIMNLYYNEITRTPTLECYEKLNSRARTQVRP